MLLFFQIASYSKFEAIFFLRKLHDIVIPLKKKPLLVLKLLKLLLKNLES
jgi:hypothetical protein